MRSARTVALVAVIAATGLCAACGAEDAGSVAQAPSAAASPTPSETATDEPLDGIDIGAEPEIVVLEEGETDVTAEVQEAAGGDVTFAVYDGETLRVGTWIMDPRGEDGSREAQDALDVCEAAKDLGYEHIYVEEDDGSTFVVAGHSAYGPDCTEV